MSDLCERCGGGLSYDETYDAYFCAHCRRWAEERCHDPRCQFCARRPGRPGSTVPK